jgi:uncharacterized protein (DUF608 family)
MTTRQARHVSFSKGVAMKHAGLSFSVLAVLALALGAAARTSAAAAAAPALVGPGPKPDAAWLAGLTARGERKVYRGAELETIGMPCGGVAAGQLYVRGDGTLAQWWIFNRVPNTGFGDRCYRTYRPPSPIQQGFAVRVKPEGGSPVVRRLSRDDFDAIEFIGEYPIAEVRYRTGEKPALPVEVTAEVFSPFIPLSARDSSMPVTVLAFKVRNTSANAAEVAVGGWLQNGVCLDLAGRGDVLSRNRIVRGKAGVSVRMDVVSSPENPKAKERRVAVIEDFEDGSYAKWTLTGDCFGPAPAAGTLPTQQKVSGWQGKFLVNTFCGGDGPQGTALSKPFKISEPYLAFLIGGGSHAGKTCLNLRVGDRCVRSSTGKDKEALEMQWWDVREFLGQEARLEIVDAESGPWGHVNVDNIYLTNEAPKVFRGPPEEHPGFGDMAITAVAADATAAAACPSEEALLADLADDGRLTAGDEAPYPLGAKRLAAAASAVKLAPGEAKTLVFLVTWNFPNRPKTGRAYANWFKSSVEVAEYVAADFDRLSADTHLFRDTYFDTTLPYWLAARLAMPVSILATETCQWWKDGRFYAWEGVGCCPGTCTHVWNYEHASGRLFPELARSTRLMQDLGEGFDAATGLIGFRGNNAYAADGQCGSILKVYREHLMSPDRAFLDAAWPKVRKAMDFLLAHDGNDDGLIEDVQHNTFDINFVGPNTFVGSLYLAAVYKHNWTSDVGPYNNVHPPQRWFARPGEAGLFTCTWPRGGRPDTPVLYRDEVWTGIEYQAAGHMLAEGMAREALAIIRGVHDRYDGARHNPWNEVECGDHYARAMASWGCLLAAEGYVYDGPAGKIGFGPRLTPEDFKAFFTAAEGWGSLAQKRAGRSQTDRIDLKWGKLRVRTLRFEVPENVGAVKAEVTAAGRKVAAQVRRDGTGVTLSLAESVTVSRGEGLEVVLTWE